MLQQMLFTKANSLKALDVFVTLHNQLAGQNVLSLKRVTGWDDLLDWSKAQPPSSNFTLIYERPDKQFSFSMQRAGGHKFVFVRSKAPNYTLRLTQCQFDAAPVDFLRASKYSRMVGELMTLKHSK